MSQQNSLIWEGKAVGPLHQELGSRFGIIVVASEAHGSLVCRFDDRGLLQTCKENIDTGTPVTVHARYDAIDHVAYAYGIQIAGLCYE